MNDMNQLIGGNKTIQQLRNSYRETIVNAMKEFVQMIEEKQKDEEEITISPDAYETFRESHPELQYTDYSDMVALLKVEESDLQQSKSRKDAKYMKITDKLLVRKLANDLCQDDLEVYFNHYNQENMEKHNDRIYQLIERLGYTGERDLHIPELVRGNFQLFREKRNAFFYTRDLIEIEERIKYFLSYMSHHSNHSLISHESIYYLMKERGINDIVKEMYGNAVSFGDVITERLKEKERLFIEEDVKKSKERELDVYNKREELCDELTMNPQKEVDFNTYQQLDNLWFDPARHEAKPIIKSGFQEYKDMIGMQYMREQSFSHIRKLSEKILQSRRIKNYFQNSFETKDAYDALLKEMVLLDEIQKQNEKPVPEFALLDSTEKAMKAIWHFSEKVADIAIQGIDYTVAKTKKGIQKYRLKRPTPNAVIYVGKHVLVEKIDSKQEEKAKKQTKRISQADDFGNK